jgi:hypothetical protein
VKNMFYVGETIRVHTSFPANAGSLIKLQGRR